MFYAWYLEHMFQTGLLVPPPLAIETGWTLVAVRGIGVVSMNRQMIENLLVYHGW